MSGYCIRSLAFLILGLGLKLSTRFVCVQAAFWVAGNKLLSALYSDIFSFVNYPRGEAVQLEIICMDRKNIRKSQWGFMGWSGPRRIHSDSKLT
jgi:hypothetical protein